MCNGENRCIRIGIDRNDLFTVGHTGTVLNGTADTAGNVEFRTDSDTCLTDLVVMIDPSGIDCCTGGTDFTAESSCEVMDEFEVGFGTDTVTAGDDDLCAFEVDRFFLTDTFDDFDDRFLSGESDIDFNDLTFAGGIGSIHFHDTFADSDHLRIVPCIDDRSDDIAAESRTDLHEFVGINFFIEFIFKIIDLEIGAVCGETGEFFGSHAGSEFSAFHGCPEEKDIGSVFFDQIHDDLCIGENGERFQTGIFSEEYSLASIAEESIGTMSDIVPEENSFEFDIKPGSEFCALADEFETDIGDFTAFLLDENPNVTNIGHAAHPNV